MGTFIRMSTIMLTVTMSTTMSIVATTGCTITSIPWKNWNRTNTSTELAILTGSFATAVGVSRRSDCLPANSNSLAFYKWRRFR
jgi:hypothetical protein